MLLKIEQAGVPAEYVGFASFSEAIKQREFQTSKSDMENLLGRTPTSDKAFLRQVYTAKN